MPHQQQCRISLVENRFERFRNEIFNNLLHNQAQRVRVRFFFTKPELKFDLVFFVITGTESSRSIDQVCPCHQIVSLIENKAKKLCKNQAVDMIAYEFRFLFISIFHCSAFSHTETQLVRCYPSGFRVDSSNFNPLHLWTYGIQYVSSFLSYFNH